VSEEKHNLIAFLAVLGTIGLLFIISAVCLFAGRSVEAIGISGVMTGLIGVLGTFRPKSAPAQNIEKAENVSQGNQP
jgi:hypothetical protein